MWKERRNRKKKERIMPSLGATTYALARKQCVSTYYVRTNNAKFNGHYVCPRTETVREHALRSHQYTQRKRVKNRILHHQGRIVTSTEVLSEIKDTIVEELMSFRNKNS